MPGAYLISNIITDNATLTPSSEDTAYPVENVYDVIAANVFRCTSKTSLTLLVDLGSAVEADTIALVNHNLTQAGVATLYAGNVNPPVTLVASINYRQHDAWKSFTLQSARYWLLTLTDSNPDYLQLGQLLIGRRTAMPVGRRMGGYKPAKMRGLITEETIAGVIHSYLLYERMQFNPIFRVKNQTELDVLSFLDALAFGNIKPWLWIPDESGTACYYVRKEGNFEPEEQKWRVQGEMIHDYMMQLTEESRGLEIME